MMLLIAIGDRFTSQVNLGISSHALAWISVVGFTLIFMVLGYLFIKIPKHETGQRHLDDPLNNSIIDIRGHDYDEALLHADVSTLNRAQRRARAKLQMKKHRRLDSVAPRQNVERIEDVHENDEIHRIDNNQDENSDQEGDDDVDEFDGDGQIVVQNLTRKERQRLAKFQEREERRMYEQLRREKSRLMDETLSREKREKEKAALEEQEKLLRQRKLMALAEQERKRLLFVYPGKCSKDNKDQSMTIEAFVNLIVEEKRIDVKKMAHQLSVSTSDLIDRIRQLEDEDSLPLPGIFDRDYDFYYLMSNDDIRSVITALETSGPMSLSSFRDACQSILSRTHKGQIDDDILA